MKLDRATILITVVAYLLGLAFQYGVFSARISALETSIQEIKVDVHEIRDHVWTPVVPNERKP